MFKNDTYVTVLGHMKFTVDTILPASLFSNNPRLLPPGFSIQNHLQILIYYLEPKALVDMKFEIKHRWFSDLVRSQVHLSRHLELKPWSREVHFL